MRHATTIASLCVVSLVSATFAIDRTWIGGSGNLFDTPGNWSPSGSPGVDDTLIFTLPVSDPPHTVLFATSATPPASAIHPVVSRVFVDSSMWFNILGPSTLDVTFDSALEEEASLTIGRLGSGSPTASLLTHLETLTTRRMTLGLDAGSSGSMTVHNQVVNVSGNLAEWSTIIGRYGQGDITLYADCDLIIGGKTVLGLHKGSSGTLSFTGSGPTLHCNGDLVLGMDGSATLNMNSGFMYTNSVELAMNPGSNAVLNIAGGVWNNGGDGLKIGTAGDAQVNVTNVGRINGPVYVGYSAGTPGELNVSGFGMVTSAYLGNVAGSEGVVNISGNGTVSSARVGAVVGGSGIVNISGSGKLSGEIGYTAGSIGVVNVADNGTFIGTSIGVDGVGTVNVTGGQIQSEALMLGENLGSEGTINLTGPNSSFTQASGDFVYVGFLGDGHIELRQGAHATLGSVISATFGDADFSVLVTDPGSELITLDDAVIARFNHGDLMITNGGHMSSSDVTIAHFVSAQVDALVDGADSSLTAEELIVGFVGDATLQVSNGGSVSALRFLAAVAPASTCDVTIDGATSHVSGDEYAWIGFNGPGVNAGKGTLTLRNGGTITAPLVVIGKKGNLIGNGTVDGDLENRGIIAPGDLMGSLDVTGDFEQRTNGALTVELASDSSFDQILIDGNAKLNGTLNVSLIGGFAPAPGSTFVILSASNISGAFSTVNLPEGMTLTYAPGEVIVGVDGEPEVCLGDFVSNTTFQPPADGIVSGADLGFLLGEWGVSPGSPADIVDANTFLPPGDGVVDGADLAILLGNWGTCN